MSPRAQLVVFDFKRIRILALGECLPPQRGYVFTCDSVFVCMSAALLIKVKR